MLEETENFNNQIINKLLRISATTFFVILTILSSCKQADKEIIDRWENGQTKTAIYFKSTASSLNGYAIVVGILLTGMSFNCPLKNSQHPAKQSRKCLPEAWGIDTIPPESQIEATPRAVEQKQESEGVICVTDPKPEFEGGETALLKYVAESIRYPANALENRIEGKVIVQFLVEIGRAHV